MSVYERLGRPCCQPSFPAGDDRALKARVAFGAADQEALAPPATALERRCALRAVKQRLDQASFREAVITAYSVRCALSGLPESLLLDADIVADKDEQFRRPVVPNGIPLSKIHHAAFDAHLIASTRTIAGMCPSGCGARQILCATRRRKPTRRIRGPTANGEADRRRCPPMA